MITKRELVELLWGLAKGDKESIRIRNEAVKNGIALWSSGEWIYVKGIELSLKKVFNEIEAGRFELESDIVDSILGNEIDSQFQSNKFVLQKMKDCRESLEMLSNNSRKGYLKLYVS